MNLRRMKTKRIDNLPLARFRTYSGLDEILFVRCILIRYNDSYDKPSQYSRTKQRKHKKIDFTIHQTPLNPA
jgi:hypothetical protein